MDVKLLIENTKKQVERIARCLAWVERHEAFLVEHNLETSLSFGDSEVDVDFPTREQVVLCISHWGGKWKKIYTNGTLSYHTEHDGVKLRLYAAGLPPSCKLVTTEVEVPAHTVPATKQLVHKIVCNDGTPVENEPTEVTIAPVSTQTADIT